MMEIHCTPAENGLTALEVLQHRLPQSPRSYLRQLLRRGKVRCHGLPVAEDCRLTAGDRLELPASRRLEELLATPAAAGPAILFENRDLLAVYKPAGVAIHRGVGHDDNLADRVQSLMRRRGEPFRTAPAHRLDAATSGPVLFGKGRRAIAALGEAFRHRDVEKVYLALAAGRPSATSGRLLSPVPAKGKWKEAAADFRLVEARTGFTLLEIRLVSGRTHQIRRQLADAGHPLAGDRRYGGPTLAGLDRLFLHCRRLALRNPLDHTFVEVDCPLPDELTAALAGLDPVTGDHPSGCRS